MLAASPAALPLFLALSACKGPAVLAAPPTVSPQTHMLLHSVTAESNLVVAETAYAKAKVEMDRATGQTLNNNDISLDEAFRGVVSRPPNPIPDVPPTPALPK